MFESGDAFADDVLRVNHGILPRLKPGFHDLTQIVERIQKHVVEFADVGLDVTRDREVDHHHRSMSPRLESALNHTEADDR